MRFTKTGIAGLQIVEAELLSDDRGFFTRLSCSEEMKEAGIDFLPRQVSLSRNFASHTLRGMHYTTVPENKLVRCVRGRVFDVALDLRPESPSFTKWFGIELDADGAKALFIPSGVAHGFLTLEDNSDVLYQIDRVYVPGFEAGARWNDARFGIVWPALPSVMHPRDAAYSDYTVEAV